MTARVDAPPFGYPTTREILDTPWNGLTHFGTFSGTGGSSLGYRWAGFRNLGALEFIPEARATYLANFGADALVLPNDVRDVTGDDLMRMADVRWRQQYDEPFPGVDVLEGSPPCSAFSLSGRGSDLWGKTKTYSSTKQHAVEDLFFEFVRLVGEIRPRAFTGENVPGLAAGNAKGYLWDILEAFRAVGYTVEAKILDAQWLGVPQTRRRLFFVGFADAEIAARYEWPTPLGYRYSVGRALADVPAPIPPDEVAEPFDHGHPDHGGAFAVYEYWRRLPLGGSPKGSYFNLIRSDPGRPAPTITAMANQRSSASATHWAEPRKFHIPELRRICGFPDDWQLTGPYTKQAERLGRAVPPPMARAIAETVATALKGDP